MSARSPSAHRPLFARSLTALTVLLCSLQAAPALGQTAASKPGQAAAPSTAKATPATTAAPTDSSETAAPATTPDPTVTQAAEHYDRGLRLHAEGDFALAAIEFERAYELVPDYRALFNIAQVRLQLGQYARAKRALAQYLVDGGDQIPPERRKSVEADLLMLAGRTGTLSLEVNVPGAEVSIDDVPVGKTPFAEPLLLDAGEHQITVRKPGYQAESTQITLVGGDKLESKIVLEMAQPESQRIIVEREVEESNREAWMWGMWTASGVLAIASGITAGLGVKAAGDLDDMRGELGATRSELDSASRRARTLLLTGDVLGGLAIVAAGTAVYLTLSGDEEQPPNKQAPAKPATEPKVGVWVSPLGVSLTGSY